MCVDSDFFTIFYRCHRIHYQPKVESKEHGQSNKKKETDNVGHYDHHILCQKISDIQNRLKDIEQAREHRTKHEPK
jgi:hypothetical protein